MIKTVLFDLGNVILPFDVTRLAKRLASYSPLTPDVIIPNLWNDGLADQFETGKMTPHQYFLTICHKCQITDLSFHDFQPIFNDIFNEDQDVVSVIEALKPKVKLGLISNTNPIHSAYIISRYHSLKAFDKIWFSNDVGLRKPDLKIYELALTHFSNHPSECVFIDDMEINIIAAKEVGLKTVWYKNVSQLREQLSDLGLDLSSMAA